MAVKADAFQTEGLGEPELGLKHRPKNRLAEPAAKGYLLDNGVAP